MTLRGHFFVLLSVLYMLVHNSLYAPFYPAHFLETYDTHSLCIGNGCILISRALPDAFCWLLDDSPPRGPKVNPDRPFYLSTFYQQSL